MAERGELDRVGLCAEVRELLPAYLNQSLEAEETRRIEAHLKTCAVCRQEEVDTRAAWSLYEGHLPVELLLDYALEQPLPARGLAVVERHLAECERCAAEVASVRQDRIEPLPDDAQKVVPISRRSRARPGRLAWAAILAAVVASASWIWTWRPSQFEHRPDAARPNLAVFELLPSAETSLRQGSDPQPDVANRLEIPPQAEEIVLVLLAGGRTCESGCFLELRAPGAERYEHRIDGLLPSPDGHLTLAIPTTWLLPQRSLLVVYDQDAGEPAVEYLIEGSRPASSEG